MYFGLSIYCRSVIVVTSIELVFNSNEVVLSLDPKNYENKRIFISHSINASSFMFRQS